ncbi:MAG: FAD-dependent oxidoreductase [Ignavibacteria bacterium]|jgi:predicted ferric reductase|nr:FAD-dependent oxidoreductase [Ignavibacteria bacterium]MDH7527487.1 FAD-dependent oxidoreductase [Ignavibacteria bacterium]
MPIIKKYRAKVVEIKKHFDDLITLSLISEKKFIYLPGQFLHLALDDYDGIGEWPESRCFSIQSSPDEKELKITFSVKGNYTKRMREEIQLNKFVWLKLPYGDMFQRNYLKENCVFIAGGTGVTPFLSLFNHNSFYEFQKPKIYLGFRNKNYNVFEIELGNIKNYNYEMKIFYEDLHGNLNIESIFRENPQSKTYFISGPPLMIKNFKNFLINIGINQNCIITDDWE